MSPDRFAPDEWWAIPTFDPNTDNGSALRVVPAKVGKLVTSLLAADMKPTSSWEHRTPRVTG